MLTATLTLPGYVLQCRWGRKCISATISKFSEVKRISARTRVQINTILFRENKIIVVMNNNYVVIIEMDDDPAEIVNLLTLELSEIKSAVLYQYYSLYFDSYTFDARSTLDILLLVKDNTIYLLNEMCEIVQLTKKVKHERLTFSGAYFYLGCQKFHRPEPMLTHACTRNINKHKAISDEVSHWN